MAQESSKSWDINDLQDKQDIHYKTANKQGIAKYGRMTFIFSKK